MPIFDLDVEPWNGIKKRDIKPAKLEYACEVMRCAEFLIEDRTRPPKAANWPTQRSTEWLEENPIRDEADVSFLKSEISRIKDENRRRQEEEAREQSQQQGSPGKS